MDLVDVSIPVETLKTSSTLSEFHTRHDFSGTTKDSSYQFNVCESCEEINGDKSQETVDNSISL